MTQMFTTGDEPGEMYRDLSLDSETLPEDVKKELLEEVLSQGCAAGPCGWFLPFGTLNDEEDGFVTIIPGNPHFDGDAFDITPKKAAGMLGRPAARRLEKAKEGHFIRVDHDVTFSVLVELDMLTFCIIKINEGKIKGVNWNSVCHSLDKAFKRVSGEAVLSQEKIIRIFRRCFVDKGFFDKHFKPKLLELLNQHE